MANFLLPPDLGGEPIHELTEVAYAMLGDAMTAGDDTNDFLLLKLMDCLVHHLKPVWDLVLDSPDRPGWWDAFNPNALPGQRLPWLPWLAQFTGDFYDEGINDVDPSAPSPDQVNRNKVAQTRNWHRGTVPVLLETIQERLPAGVTITEAESWVSLAFIITSTSDLSQGQMAAVYQAVSASLPAGDYFQLYFYAGKSYDQIQAGLNPDSFDQRQARYPLFSSIAPTALTYGGYKTAAAADPAAGTLLTWDYLETFITTWTAVESFTWDALEAA